jgi:FKBP-type peptidyl-prolyl cis-trans isomerase FkpA
MRFAVLIFASLLFAVIASAEPSPTPAAQAAPAAAPAPAKKEEPKKEEAKKPDVKKTETAAAPAKLPNHPKTLVVEDLAVGSGKAAAKGKTIKVHYTGWIYDPAAPNGLGKQLDSSHKRGEPWSFVLGSGQVIKGWEDGFKDMKVGGKRRLIIPSDLAYGKKGARTQVPPDTPLMYEVELVDVIDTM